MDTRGRTLCLITTLVCFVNGTASWGQQTYNPTASDLGGRHVAQAASFTFTPIDVPGASSTQAHGINSSGQIVGVYFDSPGGTTHGFLATPKKKRRNR